MGPSATAKDLVPAGASKAHHHLVSPTLGGNGASIQAEHLGRSQHGKVMKDWTIADQIFSNLVAVDMHFMPSFKQVTCQTDHEALSAAMLGVAAMD